VDNIQIFTTEEEGFSLEDIDFGVKWIWKSKDIEGLQVEILKFGGPIFIPYINRIFNSVIK